MFLKLAEQQLLVSTKINFAKSSFGKTPNNS